MGLKIAKFLKKNVSFKNVVKLAGVAVPGVGGSIIQGLQASAEAKKQARNEAEAQKANLMAQEVGTVAGGAVGTIAGKFISGTAKEVINGANKGIQDATGYAGSKVVDNTIRIWIKEHKTILWGALGSIVLMFVAFRKKPRSTYKRR